ncbi:MAG: AbrB/MazE/SpoVT family DNA-binding domain-containing protein [Burkholderiales bacterium]
MSEPKGIKWSAPVLIRADKNGLAVSLPPQVIEALRVGEGDVLNFTQLPDGAIEVWMVKKSAYSSLDAMSKAPPKSAVKQSKKKKPAKSSKGRSQ